MKEISHPDTVTILLAAGSSSRMGQSKQLLDVKGVPLLRHSVHTALSAGTSRIVVVLGANEPSHREVIRDLPVDIVVNHYWQSGMGSSIKTALHYIIREHAEAKAVLMMVCDQPKVTSKHLHALVNEYFRSGKKIVASSYANAVGVPAVFGRSFFSNMLMLKDDEGARKIIAQFSELSTTLPFPDGALDLDTMDDYTKFRDQITPPKENI
ncbi:nucleotidyltransferase family protein [Chryseolinea sp. T2]|uniref:nucleotidyltransferase family protein n=1 Tax=Chryseolinea sp. T2 TaxID=3129255 RepID=UPI00307714D5